jgi:flagellar biogenesis protein FliO
MGDVNGFELLSRLLPALALVALLPLGVWWLQRRRKALTPDSIRVTTRTAMGKSNWIAVVEVEGRRFLIATGEKGASMLTELEPAPPEPVATEATGLSEASRFDGILTDTDDAEGPRKGLIRRLQDSTLRRAPTSRGPQFEFDS